MTKEQAYKLAKLLYTISNNLQYLESIHEAQKDLKVYNHTMKLISVLETDYSNFLGDESKHIDKLKPRLAKGNPYADDELSTELGSIYAALGIKVDSDSRPSMGIDTKHMSNEDIMSDIKNFLLNEYKNRDNN